MTAAQTYRRSDTAGSDHEAQSLPVFDARDLTQGGKTATILLDNQHYTLRITRAAKLILTK